MNSRILTLAGSVAAAMASSACCWLPLVLMAAGLSAAGVGAFFATFRVVFLVSAANLLALGFYLNYFRKERCNPDGTCSRPRFRGVNRAMLWISSGLVLAFALFPNYVGVLFGAPTSDGAVVSEAVWTLGIEGMTCTGCEAAVSQSLLELPGVIEAETSYEDANSIISLGASRPPTRMELAAAVGRAGYALVSASKHVAPEAADEAAPRPALAGHWTADIEDQDGQTIQIAMDLGVLNERWVGEFDLAKFNVLDYPVEVISGDNPVVLFLTAVGLSFSGAIDEDGTLRGTGRSGEIEAESITFQRTGAAIFSNNFLELETAADDSSRVEILSNTGAELRNQFNKDVQKTRLLMLLAPT